MDKRILLTECSDATGLIAKITDACFVHNLNVIRQDQFASAEDGKFFMRSVLEGDFKDSEKIIEEIKKRLPEGAKVSLNDTRRRRLCVLVTREAHCLGELLMKSYSGALNADIVSVIGNHDDLGGLAAKFNVP
ncbi:MAG TPA: formyltetrahydrofolate deformylase, partial [Succinivibrionaceae bacterium]|nr:formyltetrahydrofolate deformylase [Succinivibrionaceae bacterium]